jgi:hypothetical protein
VKSEGGYIAELYCKLFKKIKYIRIKKYIVPYLYDNLRISKNSRLEAWEGGWRINKAELMEISCELRECRRKMAEVKDGAH